MNFHDAMREVEKEDQEILARLRLRFRKGLMEEYTAQAKILFSDIDIQKLQLTYYRDIGGKRRRKGNMPRTRRPKLY